VTITLVTGTGTGIGKTVVTAALVARALAAGKSVAAVKPVQTGVSPGEPADVDEIGRLSGCSSVHELQRLPDPLAPETAARISGVRLASCSELARSVLDIARDHDEVFAEGSGGLLVRLDNAGGTLLDLADALSIGAEVRFVVVTTLDLGTLNHTELTVNALRVRGFEPAGLLIGRRPPDPLRLAERSNLDDLPRLTRVPILGAIPDGATNLTPAELAAAFADPTLILRDPTLIPRDPTLNLRDPTLASRDL
jgi:dethiobiotin synthetase